MPTTPLKIYLDTSDYSLLYRENIKGEHQTILDFLVSKKEKGEIEIGYSYPIVWELLQDFGEEHRADRIRRARFLKRLCGKNAYRYLTELKKYEALSREGNWYPPLGIRFGVGALREIWLRHILGSRKFAPNRSRRNALKNPRHLRSLIRANPNLCDLSGADLGGLPISKEFIKGDIFYKYMAGEISERDADREFLRILTDLEIFINTWFDYAGKKNEFTELVRKTTGTFRGSIEIIRDAYAKQKTGLSELKKIEKEAYKNNAPSPLIGQIKEHRNRLKGALDLERGIKGDQQLSVLLEDHMLEVLIAYFETNLFQANNVNDSDFADVLHAAYIPHTDLWRGDSKFAHTLISGKITHREKIVPSLLDLPERIERLLRT